MIIPKKIAEALEFYAREENWYHISVDDRGGWEWSPDWAWENGPNPWDIAAKALMEIEA